MALAGIGEVLINMERGAMEAACDDFATSGIALVPLVSWVQGGMESVLCLELLRRRRPAMVCLRPH